MYRYNKIELLMNKFIVMIYIITNHFEVKTKNAIQIW